MESKSKSKIMNVELKILELKIERGKGAGESSIEMKTSNEKWNEDKLERKKILMKCQVLRGKINRKKSLLGAPVMVQIKAKPEPSVKEIKLKREEKRLGIEILEMKLERAKPTSIEKGIKMELMNGKVEPSATELKMERDKKQLEFRLLEMKLERSKSESKYVKKVETKQVGWKRKEVHLKIPMLETEGQVLEAERMEIEREREQKELEFQLEIQLKRDKVNLEFQILEMKVERIESELKFVEKKIKKELSEEPNEKPSTMELTLKQYKKRLELRIWEMKLQREKANLESRILEMKLERMETEARFLEEGMELEEIKTKVQPSSIEIQLTEKRAYLEFQIMGMKFRREELELTKLLSLTATEIRPRREEKKKHVILLGGQGNDGNVLRSVNKYFFDEGCVPLPSMNTPRSFMSSVIVGNEIVVSGGDTGPEITDTIETLNLENPQQWITSLARLPVPLSSHQTVVHQGRLIVIGGHNGNDGFNSNKIYEVLLTPPYSTRVLHIMPQPRAWHGAELIHDEIFIFGGARNVSIPNNDVWAYNLVSGEFRVLQNLPYAVQGLATVNRWDNVILLGGVNRDGDELNNVIRYDTQSGTTDVLRPMMENRGGCSAVILIADAGFSSDISTDVLVALGSLQNVFTAEYCTFPILSWGINLSVPPDTRKYFSAVASPTEMEQ